MKDELGYGFRIRKSTGHGGVSGKQHRMCDLPGGKDCKEGGL